VIHLAQRGQLSIRQGSGQAVAWAGEIEITDRDESRACHCGELIRRERSTRRSAHHGREGQPVVSRLVRVLDEQPRDVVVRVAGAVERGEDLVRAGVVRAEHVLPDAGEDKPVEAMGLAARQTEQGDRPE